MTTSSSPEPLRWAAAGLGAQMREYLARAYADSTMLKLVGGVDLVAEPRSRFARRHRVATVTSLETGQRRWNPDLWVVATPAADRPGALTAIAEASPETTIGVLAEKPLAPNIRDAIEGLRALTERGHVVTGNYDRFMVGHQVQEMIGEQLGPQGLGEVISIDAVWAMVDSFPAGSIADVKKSGGGAGIDLVEHPFAIVEGALGPIQPLSVSAFTSRRMSEAGGTTGQRDSKASQVEDLFGATYRLRDGTFRVELSWDAHDKVPFRVRITGTRATAVITMDDDEQFSLTLFQAGRAIMQPTGVMTLAQARRAMLEDVAGTVIARRAGEQRDPQFTAQRALVGLGMILDAYRSAQREREVDISEVPAL